MGPPRFELDKSENQYLIEEDSDFRKAQFEFCRIPATKVSYGPAQIRTGDLLDVNETS